MLNAETVARYFLSKDPNKLLFNKNVVYFNDRKFYEGNARLNKYLFLSQVVYLAKTGKKLFSDDFVAYDNGPVIENIMTSYGRLIQKKSDSCKLSETEEKYLDKIYFSLENATYEKLIEITHEDPEWQKLSKDTYNGPIMKLEDNLEIYKKRYKGLIAALKL